MVKLAMANLPLIKERDDAAGLEFTREWLPGYEIVQSVGSGGQGKVYKAYRKGEQKSVAIKVLLDGPFANRRQEKRLRREIKLLSRLNHPGIITVQDSGSIKGRPYLVMPFVYGCPIGVHALGAPSSPAASRPAPMPLHRASDSTEMVNSLATVGMISVQHRRRPHAGQFGIGAAQVERGRRGR